MDPMSADTNMVFPIYPEQTDTQALATFLKDERNILVTPYSPMQRLVTHLDVSGDDVDKVLAAFREFFEGP